MNALYTVSVVIVLLVVVHRIIRFFVDGTIPNMSLSLSGKNYLITGSSDGIGFETALAISKMGGRVIFACRNEEKTRETISKIEKISGNSKVLVFQLKLESFFEIRFERFKFGC